MAAQENIQSAPQENFDGIRENRTNKPPIYFNILFYGLIAWGVLFCAYFLLSGWSSQGEYQDKMNAHQTKVTQEYSGSGK